MTSKSNFKKSFKMFDPLEYGLKKEFSLLNYAKLRGWCSKVRQEKLNEYLKDIGDGSIGKETPDCAVFKVVDCKEDFRQISSCDFFYPLIEDPYMQGKIAVANVLSDIYAMGVTHIDNVLMILGISSLMTENEKSVITKQMIKGFNDAVIEAGTKVTGGQSVINQWPMIGGTAISTIKNEKIVYPNNIRKGDLLVITKPLGTQVAVNSVEWLQKNPEMLEKLKKIGIGKIEIEDMYSIAVESMSRLNKKAGELMLKYHAHGATDITGFGLLGHSKNLVEAQKTKLQFRFKSLPIIRNCDKVNKEVYDFELYEGKSSETSGGLLVALEKSNAYEYVKEMFDSGEDAWIVGYVDDLQNDKDSQVIFEKNLESIFI